MSCLGAKIGRGIRAVLLFLAPKAWHLHAASTEKRTHPVCDWKWKRWMGPTWRLAADVMGSKRLEIKRCARTVLCTFTLGEGAAKV